MEARELLVDGIDQMTDWLDGAIKGLTNEQVNFLPQGQTVSIGFNAWHVIRTADNITNFVRQRRPARLPGRRAPGDARLPEGCAHREAG